MAETLIKPAVQAVLTGFFLILIIRLIAFESLRYQTKLHLGKEHYRKIYEKSKKASRYGYIFIAIGFFLLFSAFRQIAEYHRPLESEILPIAAGIIIFPSLFFLVGINMRVKAFVKHLIQYKITFNDEEPAETKDISLIRNLICAVFILAAVSFIYRSVIVIFSILLTDWQNQVFRFSISYYKVTLIEIFVSFLFAMAAFYAIKKINKKRVITYFVSYMLAAVLILVCFYTVEKTSLNNMINSFINEGYSYEEMQVILKEMNKPEYSGLSATAYKISKANQDFYEDEDKIRIWNIEMDIKNLIIELVGPIKFLKISIIEDDANGTELNILIEDKEHFDILMKKDFIKTIEDKHGLKFTEVNIGDKYLNKLL